MDPRFEANRWPYVVAWPLTQIIVLIAVVKKIVMSFFGKGLRVNSLLFDGLGDTCNKVKETHGSSQSMHEIYNYQFGQVSGIRGWIGDFWQGCLNCQGVRNRLRLSKAILSRLIDECSQNMTEVRILSLASGTAQGLIEVLSEKRNMSIRLMLVDNDAESFRIAKELAREKGVLDKIQFVSGNAFDVEALASAFRPNIIELLGLMEYLLNEEAIELIKRINTVLGVNGFLVVSNIRRNLETRFVTHVIDWEMVYREAKDLKNLVYAGGFVDVETESEPLNLHTVAVART